MRSLERVIEKRFSCFVLFGGLNTVITYLVYLLLTGFVHYQLAYFSAYALGICLSYWFNLLFVFNSKSTIVKIIKYPLIYVIQYLLGAVFMYFFVDVFGFSGALAPLGAAVFLLLPSYYMNRIVLGG